MSTSRVTVTADFVGDFLDVLAKLKTDSVLVGIPEEKTARKAGDPINNATLLAINNFGSPANNIPARPVMSIGIKNAQDAIADQFGKAASFALTNGSNAVDVFYERAGIIASNSIKKAINDQEGFPGPAESTLKARARRGFRGTKSLIVTGQMRNAITYVVVKPNG